MIKKLIKKRNSIRHKLMIILLLITIVPTLLLLFVSTKSTLESVADEIIEANNSRMLWVDEWFYNSLRQIESLFFDIENDEKLMNSIASLNSQDGKSKLEEHEYIKKRLSSLYYSNISKIDQIHVYNHENQKNIIIGKPSLELEYSNLKFDFTIFDKANNQNIYLHNNKGVLMVYHQIIDLQSKEIKGAIIVRLSQTFFDELSNIMLANDKGTVYIVGTNKEIIYTIGNEKDSINISQNAMNRIINLRSGLITQDKNYYWVESIDNKFRVVKKLPYIYMLQSAYPILKTGILVVFILIVLSIILSIYISKRVTQPIISMADELNESDLLDNVSFNNEGEIFAIEQGIKKLVDKIRYLIQIEYQSELELREVQLRALQSQINPHFFNNTLQLIGAMALERGSKDIYELILKIGDMLRYAIYSDVNNVPLEIELMHSKNYIEIQSARFGDKFTVDYDIDDSLLSIFIPKFTLQPLIENAFQHGFTNNNETWHLSVGVRQIRNRVIIYVKDDGSGFERSRLKEIRNSLKDSKISLNDEISKYSGVGLKNVNNRLKLKLGQGYGIKVFSEPQKGTLIIVVLPVQCL